MASPSTSSRRQLLSSYLLSSLLPPQCARCGIFGCPGSGKTSLQAEVLGLHTGRAMWLQPDAHGTPAAWAPRWSEDKGAILRRCVNGQAWIPSLRLADWCLSAAWEYGDILVMVDEAHNVWHRDLPKRDGRLRVLLEGRRRGISIIMATQRPALLHPVAQNTMSVYAVGTATQNADLTLFQRICGLREPMPLHQFLLVNPSIEPRTTVISTRPLR